MDAEYGTWLMLRPRARRALVALEESLGRARGMAEHRAGCEGCRYCTACAVLEREGGLK